MLCSVGFNLRYIKEAYHFTFAIVSYGQNVFKLGILLIKK